MQNPQNQIFPNAVRESLNTPASFPADSSDGSTSLAPARARSGFTLIELLVVMAIILILMGLVVGISGAAQRSGAESRTKAQIGNLMLEFDKFRGDRGVYPQNFEQFFNWYGERYPDVVYDITDRSGNNALDAWGRNYQILNPNPNIVVIRSPGPSGNFNVEDNIRSDRL
ncbi:MAG: prepilin-type N-terminal cleavage/methylation domain-containing protein [Verrucomicrobia bacterium]|nr:prepilin-type N-terminal cleavage/methylation domain-containing protein [Verrucomicrobiota bacterium]MCH8514388.1 type II secretion system GspH family protein [Kiritimatiellia bacterium]